MKNEIKCPYCTGSMVNTDNSAGLTCNKCGVRARREPRSDFPSLPHSLVIEEKPENPADAAKQRLYDSTVRMTYARREMQERAGKYMDATFGERRLQPAEAQARWFEISGILHDFIAENWPQ